MTGSRYNVLAAISRNIRVGTLPPGAALEHPGAGPLAVRPTDRESLVAGFTRELEALTGKVTRVTDDRAATAHIRGVLAERGLRRALAWDDEWLNLPGLSDALRSDGVVLESCWLPAEPVARAARLQELDHVGVGLTGAVGGLAETGSLALISGPGRGRIASLLPPVHIAVLRVEQLCPTLAHFLAANPGVADVGSNLIVITGPSRTADIEMTLTRGVHGPGEVQVVLIG